MSEQFIRGESGTVWIGIVDTRPVDNIGIKLIAGPNTERMLPSVFFEEMTPPSECTPGTGLETQFYRVLIEESYLRDLPLSAVQLTVYVRDIDSTIGISPNLEFTLVGSEPTLDFSAMPSQFTSGNQSTLIVQINDLDGVANMECSILIKDQDDITLYSQLYIPMADGLWTLDWTPPGTKETNHTLYFACLDETSLSVTESMLIRAEAGLLTIVNEQNTTQQGEGDESFTFLIGIILGGFVIILALTSVLYSRDKEELIEENNHIPDEAWSNQNRDESQERLAEMAGISESESKEWTDEQLLGAGWTQEQINLYRVEQQTNINPEEDIFSIFEEE